MNEPSRSDFAMLQKTCAEAAKARPFKFSKLDLESVRCFFFADSSFANNLDKSSQMGFVILLVDKYGHCCLLEWNSLKLRRITRSTLAAEVLAFCQAFDAAQFHAHRFEELTGYKVPIIGLTDCKSLFDMIVSTTEKRLLVDMAALRQAHGSSALSATGFIVSSKNAADPFTKEAECPVFDRIVDDGMMNIVIDELV